MVATDVDTTLLDASKYEVWTHDVASDSLPDAAFDPVHLRHVLFHLPVAGLQRVLSAITRCLRPGSTALAGDFDLRTWRPTSATPDASRTVAGALLRMAHVLDDASVVYETRTTVTVTATRPGTR